jgi:hypothetical protein
MTDRAPRVAEGLEPFGWTLSHPQLFIGDPGGTLSVFSLVFLTRSGCHLCEEAEPLVQRLAARAGALVDLRDIDADPILLKEYSNRVPVIVGPSGRVLAEGIIDEQNLQQAIAVEQGWIAP